ncbi:MAG: ATP-binding protein [Bacteroidota bacterium]
MIRILITGPESSGKTTLAQALAQELAGTYHAEYARTYLEQRGGAYEREDLDTMLREQTDQRTRQLGKTNIFDTSALTYYQWSLVKYGKVSHYISEQMAKTRCDFALLCVPDLPWAPDPLRESPDYVERMNLFCTSAGLLLQQQQRFGIIQGTDRLALALQTLQLAKITRA